VPTPPPPEHSRWKKGQSGNPAGYSRDRRTSAAIVRLIDEKGATDAIARVWLKAMLEGDFRYFREFLERTEGKVPDRVALADDPDKKAPHRIPHDDPRELDGGQLPPDAGGRDEDLPE
jgi:hypothetical protein